MLAAALGWITGSKMVVLCMPTQQAKLCQKGCGREWTGCSFRQPWEGQVRADELGPPLVLVVLSRVLGSLPPSWASKPSKASEYCLASDPGFPWCTGTIYCHNISVRKKWTDVCFPVKAASDVPPLPGVHTFNKFFQQRTRFQLGEWIKYQLNFRHGLPEGARHVQEFGSSCILLNYFKFRLRSYAYQIALKMYPLIKLILTSTIT